MRCFVTEWAKNCLEKLNNEAIEKEVDKLIQEDTKTKLQTSFFGFCPKCTWLYKRGKETKRIPKKGDEFKSNGFYPPPLPDIQQYLKDNFISFKSRESEYKKLLDALKDENNFITVLQGMAGTGKTTMARAIGAELKECEQFTHVVSTTVSVYHNIKNIQDGIAKSLRLQWKDCKESERPKKLRDRLTNGDKILLVMDDMWDEVLPDFQAIGIPNSDNHKGCRILVTSRSKQIFNKLNCDKSIELDLLSEEDAWIMFQKYANINNSSSKEVIGIGRKIVKECKQLPAAIITIGSSLRDEDQRVHEWDMKLQSLKKCVSYDRVDDDMIEIYQWFKPNYDFMKDEAKRLFLLCSVFREDEQISVEVLTIICKRVGLFKEDCWARDKVVVAKNKLLDCYFLLRVDEKHVKMHGLVRKMAQWIKDKENIPYFSCEGKEMDLISGKFDDSKLEILFVNMEKDEDHKCMEVPNSFFETMANLRVLCFLGNGESSLSLPYSIQPLTNIRSILVNSVDLGDISIMGKLQSLETFDLFQCTLNELPKEFANLEKLKLLNLEHCEIRMGDPFEVIKKCSSLEELYFIDSFNGFCGEITLPQLRRYHICKGWAVWNNWLSRCVVFPTNDVGDRFSKETFNYCMQTAEVLLLNGIKGKWRNLMPDIVPTNLGMNDLVELCLSCVSQLQLLVDTIGSQMPNVLSKLVILKLDRMENLEELFNGALSIDCLTNLEKVSIKDCKHLQSLFKGKLNLFSLKVIELQSCPMLVSLFSQRLTYGSLVLLETLKIAHCGRLKNILVDERREEESTMEMDDRDNNNKYDGSMFPKLKVLDIEGCPLLESISPLSIDCLTNLEKVSIKDCKHLQSLFKGKQNLFGLKVIELQSCPMLVSLFSQRLSSGSLVLLETLKIAHCGRLKNIIVDERREEESTMEMDDRDNNNKYHGLMFPKLKVLDIEGCPLLESIFPFLFAPDIPVIQTIKIKRCDGLKYVFGTYQHVKFSSLRQLELCHLPNFTYMFRNSNHLKYSSVKGSTSSIPFVDADQPHDCSVALLSESLSPFSIMESYSYHLHIWERTQCLQIQSNILYNIRKIELSHFSKIKSVFIVSVVPKMLVESLTIRNCNELKNIIEFGDYDSGRNNWGSIFPKLKELYIEGCAKLKYIFGRDTPDQQDRMEIQLQLPKLKLLSLRNLQSLVAMCPKKYRITFPPSAILELIKCPQETIRSSGVFKNVLAPESLDKPFLKEYGDDIIAIPTFSISTKEPLIMEDVDHGKSHETTQTNNQGEASQKVEDLGSSFSVSVMGELEKLVSKKYLDYENMSLLTDFLVKHPFIFLKDTLLSNRYKGYAYNCLAKLLKFLQTHSVLDVLGSSHSEFLQLIQDIRKFPFDKDWLDGVEKRALFPDLQFSQDALRKLLDFKKQVTEEVGEMRLKLYLFNQQVEDLKHQLTSSEPLTSSEAVLLSIIKQECQVLETKAALIAPLGY